MKTLYQRPTYQQTRQRILAKADDLIRQLGLAKTTVADIATALGMSPANIYNFFPSKESIIQAIVEAILAELKKSIEAAIASSFGALARMEGLVLTIFRWQIHYVRNEPQLFESVLFAGARQWECVRAHKKFLSQKVTEIIEAGAQAGEFDICELSALASVLIDCLTVVLEPAAYADADDRLTENRVRSLVGFIGRALR